MHHKIRRNDKDKDENEKDKQYAKRISWSRGLKKSRSRETDGGEKIAVTT